MLFALANRITYQVHTTTRRSHLRLRRVRRRQVRELPCSPYTHTSSLPRAARPSLPAQAPSTSRTCTRPGPYLPWKLHTTVPTFVAVPFWLCVWPSQNHERLNGTHLGLHLAGPDLLHSPIGSDPATQLAAQLKLGQSSSSARMYMCAHIYVCIRPAQAGPPLPRRSPQRHWQ